MRYWFSVVYNFKVVNFIGIGELIIDEDIVNIYIIRGFDVFFIMVIE